VATPRLTLAALNVCVLAGASGGSASIALNATHVVMTPTTRAVARLVRPKATPSKAYGVS